MRTCRVDGCNRMAVGGISGCCLSHKNNYHSNTSDGLNTRRKLKLSPEQVAEARRMRAAFRTNREIARHFGVSLDTLRSYMNGERS